MKKLFPSFLERLLLPISITCLILTSPVFSSEKTGNLAANFVHPPGGAGPWVYWFWMNGNVTREGITADLEAMHRVGVSGAFIYNISAAVPNGPVIMFSPEWRELIKFAIQEADRLHVNLGLHNCPGWAESGGPWIKPEQSMQKVVWSETHAQGPRRFEDALEQPETIRDYYRDIVVLAFPTPNADESCAASPLLAKAVVTASAPDVTGAPLLSGSGKASAVLSLMSPEQPQYAQIEFPESYKAGSLSFGILAAPYDMSMNGAIEVSDDGRTFRKVSDIPIFVKIKHATIAFPETMARFFRVRLGNYDRNVHGKVTLSNFDFSGPRIGDILYKAGYSPKPGAEFSKAELPADGCIAKDKIIDLTEKLRPDGKLSWDMPAGAWTIIRVGHTSTGITNGMASDVATGLECDKMSRVAVNAQFQGMMGKVIADAGPLAGKSLKMVLADSWEAGCQNWTPAMREEFKKRYDYELLPWLITLSGHPVGSLDQSERFLWDFRRTIADLTAENHYGTFRELSHKHGMQFTAEAPGIFMPCIADELQCKGFTDVPMGEFWLPNGNANDWKEPACAAHIGGQKIAASESFTADADQASWTKSPFDHKALGDHAFCVGINRLVIHRYAMQPWLNRWPGMTMAVWGTNFERTNTWWEQGKAWVDYLMRCQYLLQQGTFQADILYFYGEGAPVTLPTIGGALRDPQMPAGYDYDACDVKTLVERARVANGRLVLPSGMSYGVLLLPERDRMTTATLRKVKALVEAGATVLGARPALSPSLKGWPQCDEEVRGLAAELWGDSPTGSRAIGKGHLVWGKTVATVLTEIGVKPDFESSNTGTPVLFIHRKVDGADVYFVSSQSKAPIKTDCTFRVSGKIPELWHADTGEIEQVAMYSSTDGRTTIPLQFDSAGSVFVVFRKPSDKTDAVIAVTSSEKETPGAISPGDLAWPLPASKLICRHDGSLVVAAACPGVIEAKTASGQALRAEIKDIPKPVDLSGAWELQFPPNWGAPDKIPLDKLISWSEHSDDGVKHFSGTATYAKEFDWQPDGTAGSARLFLDLGTVKELAQVKLNGTDLGVLWKPPFRVDITEALRPGKNRLEVRVTNLWPNRLIGDAALPKEKRFTQTTFQPYKAGDRLLVSGLLGPVTIRTQVLAELRKAN